MKPTAMIEQDEDGWWAHQKLDDWTVLGHGGTQEEALTDLEKQVAGFADFLKRTGENTPAAVR
jgi:hypothetical protein